MKLTILDYQRIILITQTFETEEAIQKEIDKTFFKDISIDKLDEKRSELYQIINDSKDADLVNRFTFKGVEYGLIPNFETMSTGEWIDINEYNKIEDLTKLISVLYRPIKKRKFLGVERKIKLGDLYKIEEYKGTSHHMIFKELDFTIATSVLFFLMSLEMNLLKDIDTYTLQLNQKMMKRMSFLKKVMNN